MRRALARLAFAAVVLVAAAGVQPAAAAEQRPKEDRAALAAKLKAAEATDAELEEAVKVLDAASKAAAAKALAAARAADRAEAEAKAAEAALAEQRRVVARRAVDAYAQRRGPRMELGSDPVTASRRLALANVVNARLTDATDQLRAARIDLDRQRRVAANRARAARQAFTDVEKAKARTAKARADLDRRMAGLEAEIAALDAESAAVERIIRERASAAAAAAAANAAIPSAAGAGPASGSGFIWPTNGRTTSEFGPRWGRMHKGLDIAAPTGTPIRASKAGRVIHAGWQGGYGNLTLIDHGGGIVTAYGHQSRLAAPQGATVGQGQLIGYVGSTGHSTGPHLHFEVRVNGVQQNPRRYLP